MVRTMLQQFFVMFMRSISKIDKSSIIDVPSLNAIFDYLGSPVDTCSSTALMLAIILDPYSRSKLLQQSLLWLCSWFNISLQGWVNRYTIVTCKNIDDIRSRVDGGSSIVLWLGLAIIIDRYSRSNIVAYYFFMATRFIWYESTYDRKTHSFDNHRSRVDTRSSVVLVWHFLSILCCGCLVHQIHLYLNRRCTIVNRNNLTILNRQSIQDRR